MPSQPAMDIARPDLRRKRRRRQLVFTALAVLGLATLTIGLSRLEPAAPRVALAQVWTDTVSCGDFLRQVRGNGSLVPEMIQWIPAVTPGRIERILVLPGAEVSADTVLVELSNPEVEQAEFDARWQLKAAEAQLTRLTVQLESEQLAQEAQAAEVGAEYNLARFDAEADTLLETEGLVNRLTALRSRTRAEQYAQRYELEKRRLASLTADHEAQLAAHQAELERLRAMLDLRRRQSDQLQVRAGIDGVLQRLGAAEPLQVGQQLSAGANIARVADPRVLKAEIRVIETQAKDVALGQTAVIDTRNGTVQGRVSRIDPAVQNGTVTVDITLAGPLPRGARPDLSVEGTIELERLENVLYVGRPVHGQSDATIGLFKVLAGGEAVRVPVKLGRSSVSTIEIVEGLEVGDLVVLSDMSQWDNHAKIKLR
jgi:HlyD family secretion protein